MATSNDFLIQCDNETLETLKGIYISNIDYLKKKLYKQPTVDDIDFCVFSLRYFEGKVKEIDYELQCRKGDSK